MMYLTCTGLRSLAFRFAALCTLPAALADREAETVQDLKEKFQKVRSFNISLYRALNCRPALSFFSLFIASHGLHFLVLDRPVKCAPNSGLLREFRTFECMSLRAGTISI